MEVLDSALNAGAIWWVIPFGEGGGCDVVGAGSIVVEVDVDQEFGCTTDDIGDMCEI